MEASARSSMSLPTPTCYSSPPALCSAGQLVRTTSAARLVLWTPIGFRQQMEGGEWDKIVLLARPSVSGLAGLPEEMCQLTEFQVYRCSVMHPISTLISVRTILLSAAGYCSIPCGFSTVTTLKTYLFIKDLSNPKFLLDPEVTLTVQGKNTGE